MSTTKIQRFALRDRLLATGGTLSVTAVGMNFDFTPEQRRLRKTVHDFVERKAPKAYARELEGTRGVSRASWPKRSPRPGLNGIGIPEEFGGEGGDIIDQVIVMRGAVALAGRARAGCGA